MAGDPELLNTALWIGGAVGAAAAAFWTGRKAGPAEPKGEATVLAGTFTDPKTFRDLASSIERFREQQHDDSRALRGSIEDMVTELRRNTAAQDQGAITPRDLVALLGRLDKKGAGE